MEIILLIVNVCNSLNYSRYNVLGFQIHINKLYSFFHWRNMVADGWSKDEYTEDIRHQGREEEDRDGDSMGPIPRL